MAQQMSEEDMKALQEKIKNMSPEELKEFQKQQCIFCSIIAGKVQSKKVYEDERTIAILDINPANPGHILLLPKEHYQIMPLMPEDEISYIFQVAKHLSQACLKAFKCQGTNIFVANGTAAGQKAQHFMVHIIPRMENDHLDNFLLPENSIPEKAQAQILKRLKKRINKMFGIKDDPEEDASEEKESPEKKESPAPKESPKQKEPSKRSSKKKVIEAEFKDNKGSEKPDLDSIADLLGGKI